MKPEGILSANVRATRTSEAGSGST